MNLTTLNIASYQGKALYDDVEHNLQIIKQVISKAEKSGIDIVCFPECFIQGYILDKVQAQNVSFNLRSKKFQDIMRILYSQTTTIILGLIEQENGILFNTAVVIEQGKLIGKYRKQHLLKKENFFKEGNDSPVFQKNGVKYGINICSDTRYTKSIKKMVRMGAQILFFPLNNSLPHDVALRWKNKHLKYWIEHAKNTSCWVVTSDVVEKSETNTGFGFTTIIDPQGKVIQTAGYLNLGMIHQKMRIR